MVIGTLAAIWRYPVKSLHGESLSCAEVTDTGLAGDRTSALFVRSGHARAGKTYRGKEHDRLHLTADLEEARALGAARGVELERRTGARFFDAAPISLILDCWLDDLALLLGHSVEPERFRPNFLVRADAAFTSAEVELTGWNLQLGELHMRVISPIERCVVVTYDPGGGPSDAEVLRVVAQQRGTWMGVLCEVVQPATVRTGDVLASVE